MLPQRIMREETQNIQAYLQDGRQPIGEGWGVREHGWAKKERMTEQGMKTSSENGVITSWRRVVWDEGELSMKQWTPMGARPLNEEEQ